MEEQRRERQLLGLGRRVVVFGGGRQSEARGGALRRLWITDDVLSAGEAAAVARVAIAQGNPLVVRSATMIQAMARRRAGEKVVEERRKDVAKAMGMSVEEYKKEAKGGGRGGGGGGSGGRRRQQGRRRRGGDSSDEDSEEESE